MKKLRAYIRAAFWPACAIALSGCAQIVSDQERLLATAGFTPAPANTPGRQAMLTQLPPHQFVRQSDGASIRYIYADPLVCDCLYIGSRAAFVEYRLLQLAHTAPGPASSASTPSPMPPLNPPNIH